MLKKEFIFLLGLGTFLFTMMNTIPGYDCKVDGCPPDYRCMANGECTPLSVREYCEDHGKPSYIYDVSLLSRNCTSEILNFKEQKLCVECKGDYELRKTVSDTERVVYGIAAGLAILMISVNGIRLITSRDPRQRESAKKGIFYVILVLIVIVIATKFIEYLIT